MTIPKVQLRILILAAYLLAALVPLFATSGQASGPVHEQMMAMAGHAAQMPGMDAPDDRAQMLLCQQHCLFAAAALPPPLHLAAAVPRSSDVKVGLTRLAASLVLPPPGPPPKVAVI